MNGFGGTIERAAGPVLPSLDVETLCVALRRLPADELAESLKTRLLPVGVAPGRTLFAACAPDALDHARQAGLAVIATAEPRRFVAAALAVHGHALARRAALDLPRRRPGLSANRRLSPEQAGFAALLLSVLLAGILLAPAETLALAASAAAGLFFAGIIALRLLCLIPGAAAPAPQPPDIPDDDLPGYTVLVPLFRETAVLGQLTAALGALAYPPDKLDIKVLLEEEDIAMRRAVAALALPKTFEVLTMPAGKPQTKPRALNFGLAFARGELLTIYDAEDIPDPRQLRKAAAVFAASDPSLACLQARLCFFNPQENWLTRQFAAEYDVLFGLLLPALAGLGLPIPLGGTSNHFRIAALRQAGGWDAFNVTEDADLGIRLARLGFRTGTLASVTFEEANTRALNWMRQRARWLKGFLATWLVHMRHPAALWRELGAAGFLTVQAVTAGVFLSALFYPVCFATAAYSIIAMPAAAGEAAVLAFLGGLNLFVLLAGHGVAMAAGWRALAPRRRGRAALGTIATMPLYWVLLCCAAWLALWQFLVAPWHWNKTEHGLSDLKKP